MSRKKEWLKKEIYWESPKKEKRKEGRRGKKDRKGGSRKKVNKIMGVRRVR